MMQSLDLDSVSLPIHSVRHLTPGEQQTIIDTFNRTGFVILICTDPSQSRQNLLDLTQFFGAIIPHNQSDPDGVFPITVMANYGEYANTANYDLALHTDGSFEVVPPKVMAMRCEQSASTGGLTRLADAQALYDYLQQIEPETLEYLFRPDVFTIKRANQTATRPIFEQHDGRISIAFRSDSAAQISVKPYASRLFQLIKEYLAEPEHQLMLHLQPHQILIFDNTRLLHGRTAFPANEPRKIDGLWFNGCSPNVPALKFGFFPLREPHLHSMAQR